MPPRPALRRIELPARMFRELTEMRDYRAPGKSLEGLVVELLEVRLVDFRTEKKIEFPPIIPAEEAFEVGAECHRTTLSPAKIQCVFDAYERLGLKPEAIARRFGVSSSSVRRVLAGRKKSATGQVRYGNGNGQRAARRTRLAREKAGILSGFIHIPRARESEAEHGS